MKITDLIHTTKTYNRTVSELHIDIEEREPAPTEIIVTRQMNGMKYVYTYIMYDVEVK